MITLLLTYKYLILLPLAVVEGPIVTIIAGFLVRIDFFNLYIVYMIVILGDILGDTIYYLIGRFGGPIFLRNFSKFFHITPEKKDRIQSYFNTHHYKTLFLSKVIHGIGVTGLMTAGNLKISYRKFFTICFSVSLLQSAFFLLIGFLFGHAYITINKYLNFFSLTTIIIGITIVFILFIKLKKKNK